MLSIRQTSALSCLPYLVCPADEVKIMTIEELADYICSKCERYSTVILSPTLHVLVRI
jgi:hypothetical protein